MSIPVAVSNLADALADRSWAYLLTVSDDGRPHAVAVSPQVEGGAVRATVGRRSATNAAARPEAVSLVWPPAQEGGYSLIVDGTALVAGETITVEVTKAVLHRPAAPDAGAVAEGACGSDCVPLTVPPAR